MNNTLQKLLPKIPTSKGDITGHLSKNLKQLMLQADVDSSELSQHTNLTISTINRLRSGSSSVNPTVTTLAPIANYFGVNIESLISNSLNEISYSGNIHITNTTLSRIPIIKLRKRRYLGRYFAHPMMQNRRAKRDDYKPSAVRVTQRCVP
ncbi:helix-turn-helix domain-containing protein [Piscirickettsia salmonis]|uniref:helix-turn-helix domain-containing protein n=2 Tax=Piscirickettsia salmonis TaxID=1238 RepID=UPI0018ACDF57|nr:helix-turn-helix transcriptional regulator [Piscirickettsia salmonis]